MATIKFIATTQAKVDSIPVAAGQLIFSTDERIIYLDTTERTTFQSIITVPTEQFRQELTSPVEAFYFVNDTKILWQYEQSEWYQLTNSPKENVVFTDEDSLPSEGEDEILYVTDTNIYRWNVTAQEYTKLGGGNSAIWQELTN